MILAFQRLRSFRFRSAFSFSLPESHPRVTRRRPRPNVVARAVQRAALRAGMNPSLFAGHRLRAGYVTKADARGAETTDIMQQAGHKSVQMIKIYTRFNVDERFEHS